MSAYSWNGRRVYDCASGRYLGRAVGEPFQETPGDEGIVRLRQDEDGQDVLPYAVCGHVVFLEDLRE